MDSTWFSSPNPLSEQEQVSTEQIESRNVSLHEEMHTAKVLAGKRNKGKEM